MGDITDPDPHCFILVNGLDRTLACKLCGQMCDQISCAFYHFLVKYNAEAAVCLSFCLQFPLQIIIRFQSEHVVNFQLKFGVKIKIHLH